MKSKESQRLSARQQQVIPHILASPTCEEAARRAKISAKQIYDWLQNPLFKEEISRRRTEVYCEALSQLKASSSKAVAALTSLLDDKEPRIRLSAAEKVLSHALKGVEYIGFEERLFAVESRIDSVIKEDNKG